MYVSARFANRSLYPTLFPFLFARKLDPTPSSRLKAASPHRLPPETLAKDVWFLALGGWKVCGRFIIKDLNKGADRVIMEKSSGGFRTTAYKPFEIPQASPLPATFRHSPVPPYLKDLRPCAVPPLTATIDVIIQLAPALAPRAVLRQSAEILK
jgi:hypothetical protein